MEEFMHIIHIFIIFCYLCNEINPYTNKNYEQGISIYPRHARA